MDRIKNKCGQPNDTDNDGFRDSVHTSTLSTPKIREGKTEGTNEENLEDKSDHTTKNLRGGISKNGPKNTSNLTSKIDPKITTKKGHKKGVNPDHPLAGKMDKSTFSPDCKEMRLRDELLKLTSRSKGGVSNMITKAKKELNITGDTKFLSAADKWAIYNHIAKTHQTRNK